MKRKKLCYAYDREADVMYFYFDRPRKAKTIELNGDFLLRLDPKTQEVVGMTGVDCSFLTTFPIPPRASTRGG